MAVEDDGPDAEGYDRPDLTLSPQMHEVQAEIAAERGEEYDPYEFEELVSAWVGQAPDPFDDAEPVA